MNIKRSYCLLGLCLLLTSIAKAQPAQGTLVEKIVANVDNQIILQSELEIAYQQYLLQGAQEKPDLKCEVLGHLVLRKALLAKAKQEGIVIEKEQLVRQLDQTLRYWVEQAGSEKALVKSSGKSIKDIENELRERIREQMMVENLRRQAIAHISATPQEVSTFFEAMPSQERPYYPAEVEVRQLVRYPQANQQKKDALLGKLRSLKVRLQNGESFESLAREYSQDSGSASRGGEIGFWRLGELAPEYEAAALALQPSEISEPIESEFGFHLIQLIAHEGDRYNSRHILLRPNLEALDIEVAKAYLTQLRSSILAGKLTFEEAAKTFSEDTETAAAGGLITREQGKKRIAIDDLPPDVFFAIEQFMPGDISEPVEFTTSDNRQAARLLLLKAKRPAHEANLSQDYAKIQQLLVQKKRENVLQAWLKEVQASVSIKVAPEYQNCELLK